MFNLNGMIFSNNNNLLLGILNDLQQVINNTHDNLIIKRIGDIIIRMNFAINENKKNYQSIMQQFSLMQQQLYQINRNIKHMNINTNTINNQELMYPGGKYVGQVVNGMAEGKGIWYGTQAHYMGNKYEGEWKNNKQEGKGIFYYNNGDRYEGDWKNGKKEGKGILYFNNGNRYEGDFKNDKREGKGIFYYNDGNREMGDYYNGNRIGKHVALTKDGKVLTNFY